MKRKLLFAGCLAAMSTAILTAANNAFAVPPLSTAWYLEGNLGLTKVSGTNYGSGTSVSAPGLSGGGIAGYKFMPFFASEIGYTRYATLKIKNPAGVSAAKDKLYAIDIAAKGILPIGDSGFEAFAKVGWSILNSSVSITNASAATTVNAVSGTHNAPGLYLGIGADYAYTPSVPINFQWARAYGDGRTGNLDLYSVGVAYLIC